MIRSFLEDIPEELEGAAMVHGMSRLKAFATVTLPLVKGGILATALFVFILNGRNSCSRWSSPPAMSSQ